MREKRSPRSERKGKGKQCLSATKSRDVDPGKKKKNGTCWVGRCLGSFAGLFFVFRCGVARNGEGLLNRISSRGKGGGKGRTLTVCYGSKKGGGKGKARTVRGRGGSSDPACGRKKRKRRTYAVARARRSEAKRAAEHVGKKASADGFRKKGGEEESSDESAKDFMRLCGRKNGGGGESLARKGGTLARFRGAFLAHPLTKRGGVFF